MIASKRWMAVMLGLLMFVSIPVQAALAAGETGGLRIHMEEEQLVVEPAPFIREGYTFAPAGPLFRALGYAIWQDAEGRQAFGEKNGSFIRFVAGETDASWRFGNSDGVLALPVAPLTINRTMFVPVRALAEFDGREVSWDGGARRVDISARPEGSITPPGDLRIDIMSESDEPLPGDDPWMSELEKETGARIAWTAVPSLHYREKSNVMIASGDMPHIMLLKQPSGYDPHLPQAFLQDIFAHLDAYPHVKSAVEQHERAAYTPDGFLMGVPRKTPIEQLRLPFIRQDWLDRLGLATPTNADELMHVMEQFAKTGPDGNGKNDTIGLTGSVAGGGELGRLSWVERLFNGSAGRFSVDADGAVTDTLLEAGTRDALEWLVEAYKNGYLNPEFAVMSEEQMIRSIEEGKAGIAELSLREAAELNRAFAEAGTDAVLAPLVGLQSPGGKPLLPAGPIYAGVMAVSQQVSEGELPAVLKVLDAIYAPPGSANGLPEPGEAVKTFLGRDADPSDWFGDVPNFDAESFAKRLEEWERSGAVWDASLPGWLDHRQKEAIVKRHGEVIETKTKLVMGAEPFTIWDELVERIETDADYRNVMAAFDKAENAPKSAPF
ncbi:stalk domain-containing protein [Paenibacillaceae bacterium WGS1546]|uniref:stalk domain-containing protein n=1 Tax=Cohnella sp. WGS1546 TaxID=3366810 RepID=UPI00372D6C0C